MTTLTARDSKVLIREAELLSASNDYIYKFYKEMPKYCTEIDDTVEKNLLLKNDQFLDMVLAQHCQHDSTIFTLFSKALQSNNLPLKLACLSNEYYGALASDLPHVLFGEDQYEDCPGLREWFKSISENEIDILFKNKALSRDWLTSFLDCKNEFWNVLGEVKQRSAIRSLSKNPIISIEYEGLDGSDNYHHKQLFYRIWDLTKNVPTSVGWAHHLGLILENTCYKVIRFDSIEVAKRWMVEYETSSDQHYKDFLNPYEVVRFHLYKNAINDLYGENRNDEHFKNTDRAYRACAYSKLKVVTVDNLNSAFSKDGPLAINYFMKNDHLWMLEKTREAFRDLCYEADVIDMELYRMQKERLQGLHPEWFVEKTSDESIEDKPLTLGEARELIKAFNHEYENGLVPYLGKIKGDLKILDRILIGVLAIIIIVLIK